MATDAPGAVSPHATAVTIRATRPIVAIPLFGLLAVAALITYIALTGYVPKPANWVAGISGCLLAAVFAKVALGFVPMFARPQRWTWVIDADGVYAALTDTRLRWDQIAGCAYISSTRSIEFGPRDADAEPLDVWLIYHRGTREQLTQTIGQLSRAAGHPCPVTAVRYASTAPWNVRRPIR